VSAATGTEAASSNVKLSGFTIKADSEAHAYSAKAPAAPAEHRVAGLEQGHVPPNRFRLARHVMAEPSRVCHRWFAQPEP